jgi:hypothetical protein
MSIIINLDKAKAIGHDIRRQQRAAEFAPLDQAIASRIPGADPEVIEDEREAIREKYALIQDVIEAAETPEEIKLALEANRQS